jgi:hypothetical protein
MTIVMEVNTSMWGSTEKCLPNLERRIENPAYQYKQDFLFTRYNSASQVDREPGPVSFGRFPLQARAY